MYIAKVCSLSHHLSYWSHGVLTNEREEREVVKVAEWLKIRVSSQQIVSEVKVRQGVQILDTYRNQKECSINETSAKSMLQLFFAIHILSVYQFM